MSKVQSILFNRKYFNEQMAIDWALSHGFKVKKIDITQKYIRIRQFKPVAKYSYRTIAITNDVSFIIAI